MSYAVFLDNGCATRKLIDLAFICVVILVTSQTLAGPLVTFESIDVGWYREEGYHYDVDAALAGYNQYPWGLDLFASYFIFDLSLMSEEFQGGRLLVPIFGYWSSDPQESIVLYDIITPISDVMAEHTGGNLKPRIFEDLRSGVVYGATTVTAGNVGSEVAIDLTSEAMNSLNSNPGTLFGIGIYLNHLRGTDKEYVLFISAASSDKARLELVVGQPSAPVADADGPYTTNVGHTLTLDASASTDADNDIVSYVWDLDNDGTFETDAGDQATFDVEYAYLDSLGLMVGDTYDIHVKVTDREDQSDVDGTTLTIVPPPVLEVAVDIKPLSCPNPINVKSQGVLPVAILGTEDFEANAIDIASVELAGVGAVRSSLEDVAGPILEANDCDCNTPGPDGFRDLTLKFRTQQVVEALGEVNDGDMLTLTLTGALHDETPIEGTDCAVVRGKHKPFNKGDINKDGIVDGRDFAIFAENWLRSSIVEE
jgi:hypothetical protein